jgi:hypothetical protein
LQSIAPGVSRATKRFSKWHSKSTLMKLYCMTHSLFYTFLLLLLLVDINPHEHITFVFVLVLLQIQEFSSQPGLLSHFRLSRKDKIFPADRSSTLLASLPPHGPLNHSEQ